MKEIKNAVIGVIVLAITSAGGVLINKYIGGEEEETKEEIVTPAQPNITINIPQQEAKKDTVVKIVKQKAKPKLTETEKRKKELDW